MLIKTTNSKAAYERENIFDTATGIFYSLQYGWGMAQTFDEAKAENGLFDKVTISSIHSNGEVYGATLERDEAASFWSQLTGTAPAPALQSSAAIAALINKWRNQSPSDIPAGHVTAYNSCANELEAALAALDRHAADTAGEAVTND